MTREKLTNEPMQGFRLALTDTDKNLLAEIARQQNTTMVSWVRNRIILEAMRMGLLKPNFTEQPDPYDAREPIDV